MAHIARASVTQALLVLIVTTAAMIGPANARAAEAIASVIALRGEVTAVDTDGTTRPLGEDASIYPRDRIATERRAAVSFRFTDGTRVALGGNTVFDVEDYDYSDEPSGNRFTTRLTRGVARFVTGLIAKRRPRAVSVNTPVATIGVRGTHFVSEVAEDESATVILLEPEDDPVRKTAIEIANAAGSVTIEDPGYGTEVADAQTAPTPPRRMQIQTVERMVRQVNAARRMRMPRGPMR